MIFGKRLSEYVAFCKPFLVLVPAIGLTRLALSLAGVSNSTTRWLSMTALVWIAVLIYSVRMHTRRFGTYKHLLVVCALLNWTAQAIAITGIIIAIATGTNNVFSSPEFAFGSDGKTWSHLAAHLFIGTTAGSLIPWLIGSLILLLARKVDQSGSQVKSVA